MKRLKIIILSTIILLFIPVWRYLDFIQIIWSLPKMYAFSFFMTGLSFISFPLFIFKLKKYSLISLILFFILSLFHYTRDSFSHANIDSPQSNHCGILTYTGTFYPLISLVTPSHADDLEIRNQLCWIRKVISEIPVKFNSTSDMDDFFNRTHEALLSPQFKFRVSLPFVGLYHLVSLTRYDAISTNSTHSNGKIFVQGLTFWEEQYTFEINSKDYPWWDLPHGPYIKWEYGLIEKNWDKLIDFINSIEIAK